MSDDVDIGLGVHEIPGAQAVIEALRAKLADYRKTLQDLAGEQGALAGASDQLIASNQRLSESQAALLSLSAEVRAALVKQYGAVFELNSAVGAAVEATGEMDAVWEESRVNVLAHMQALEMDANATYHLGETYTATRSYVLAHAEALKMNESAYMSNRQVVLQHAEALLMNESAYTRDRSVVLAHAAALKMDESAYTANRAVVMAHAEALQMEGTAYEDSRSIVLAHIEALRMDESIYTSNRAVVMAHAEALRMSGTVYEDNRAVVLQHAKALQANVSIYEGDRAVVLKHAEALRMDESAYTANRSVVLAHGQALLINETAYRSDENIVRQHSEALRMDAAMQQLNVNQIDKIPVTARRGANAMATLAFGLESGAGSARSMAIGIGSTISAMASFAETSEIAAAATGIGALITVLAIVVGLFYELDVASKKAEDSLGDVSKFSVAQLRSFLQANETDLNAAQARVLDFAKKQEGVLAQISVVGADYYNYEARQAQAHYETLVKLREGLNKKLVEMETQQAKDLSNLARTEQEKAAESTADLLHGPDAAKRLEAAQRLTENLRKLNLEMFGSQQDHDKVEQAYRIEYHNTIAAIDRDANQRLKDQFEKYQLERIDAEAKNESDVYQVKRDAVDRRYNLAKEAIEKDRTLDPGQRARQELLILQTQTAGIITVERERSEEIAKIRGEAQDKLNQLSGVDVDETKIRQSFKKQIDVLKAAIASVKVSAADKAAAADALGFIDALIPEEVAKARIEEIVKTSTKALDTQQQAISRTNALSDANLLTDGQKRERILAALIAQRDTVMETIPLLEQQAALLPGNVQAQDDVEKYKTKLLELAIQISQVSDEFYKLKTAGIEATESAITSLITNVPKVINQSQADNAINQMRVHLASAQAELNDLMKGPQTAAVAQRITQLRAEIQGVNIDLGNAKSQLITWQSLFLDAARSIISALFEVEARMIAVLIVQKSLALFGGGVGGNSGVTSAIQIAGEVVGGSVGAASGGLIRGPGTGMSDSIPARLSDGEYVINAASTARLGASFLDALNSMGTMPRVNPRRGYYAAGGLVAGGDDSGNSSQHNVTLGLEDGLVLRHLESSEGQGVLLKWAERNRNKLRQLLG